MATSNSTQLMCDEDGHVSELVTADGSQTSFTFPTNFAAKEISQICNGQTGCKKYLSDTFNTLKEVTAISVHISSHTSVTELINKMRLASEIKRAQNHMDKCKDKTPDNEPHSIYIDYPQAGPNKFIRGDYVQNSLKKLIQMSLLNGVDPFLVLAISAVEAPHFLNPSAAVKAEHEHSDLLIDGLPIYDSLGCAKPMETKSESYAAVITPAAKPKTIQLPWGGLGRANLCSPARNYKHGESPSFKEAKGILKDSCCVTVKGLVKGDNPQRELVNYMAISFLKNKVRFPAGAIEESSYNIQVYNGTGCFGCTEKVQNSCLSGIHMGSRPQYGARVADLMLNSIMANTEIRKLVAEVSSELREKVPSSFCQKNGAGTIAIDNNTFYNQQRKFLLDGASGSIQIGDTKKTFMTKLTNGKLGTPNSEKDLKQFRETEKLRKQSCEKQF